MTFHPKGLIPIKVSAKSARLKFIECGPECIKTKNCTAKCCDAPSRPNGMLVTVLPQEEVALKKRGAAVVDGILQPEHDCRGCPFKGLDHLCRLHDTPDKPFGCIASPFMLNKCNTLVVRNRYKLLPCYDSSNGLPAYQMFKSSLELLFGTRTQKLIIHLDNDGGDIYINMEPQIYKNLTKREGTLRGTKLK